MMNPKDSRRLIEVLRSGVPSRQASAYFTNARVKLRHEIERTLDQMGENGQSSCKIITGKYGEGKTHLLNTVFNMASERNMVVSMIPLSKEIPFNKLDEIYASIMRNTYLPDRAQPGFMHELHSQFKNSEFVSRLVMFTSTELERNRLMYLVKTYAGAKNEDDIYRIQADFQGAFLLQSEVKKLYKGVYKETARFNEPWKKTEHIMDYFYFMSYVFECLGYHGWVILFDEAELTGRLGIKSRMKAYGNMDQFVDPSSRFRSVYTMMAFTSSYTEDVIEKKHDYEYLDVNEPANKANIKYVLDQIIAAPQLAELTRSEIKDILLNIIDLHKAAYNWDPGIASDEVICTALNAGYLLRTKIRTAIELLDQLYQYGEAGSITIGDMMSGSYEEIPSLDELNEEEI